MDNTKKYLLYDKIISSTYANIFSLSKNNDIILKRFNYENSTSRVFLEVACMVAYITGKEIYLQTGIIDFLKVKLKKKNKHIHRIKKSFQSIDGINIEQISIFEAEAFQQNVQIFDDIFNAYYNKERSV